MELAPILEQYQDQVLADTKRQKAATFKEQKQALNAIISCRTPACGEIEVYCPHCRAFSSFSHSCGHRSCPKCQHHETSRWFERQRQKLLPVPYFLVTFTLPAELRALARYHPKFIYSLIFQAASESLQTAALNPKYFGGRIGFTGVLHTNSRRLDLHPHVHFIVPGFAYHPQKQVCIHSSETYLIPEPVLGRLFRGKFLSVLKEKGFYFARSLYQKDWVVDCEFSGKGDSALKYLSRYLYRGVISEKNILFHQDGQVTFRYTDSETKEWRSRHLPGAQFAKLVLQHVLPKGFRRARDFGFLHGNARKTLIRIQLLLRPSIKNTSPVNRPAFKCPCCGKKTIIVAVGVYRSRPVRRSRSPPGLSQLAETH
jgi:hypothetical protein